MKNRKAFSIVETVVAITVIVIISISVISVITLENSKSKKNAEANNCLIIVENTLEIFKASDDETAFKNGIEGVYQDFTYNSETSKYVLELTMYRIEISVDFDQSPYDFVGLCFDKDEKEALRIEYEHN